MIAKKEAAIILKRREKLGSSRAVLLEAFHILAEKQNLDEEIVEDLAGLLDMEPLWIWQTLTSYELFNYREEGKYVLSICTGLGCSLAGSEKIVEHLKKSLGVEVGETTPDRLFTLKESGCLGCCSQPPVMQINRKKCYFSLDERRVDEILDELRRQQLDA